MNKSNLSTRPSGSAGYLRLASDHDTNRLKQSPWELSCHSPWILYISMPLFVVCDSKRRGGFPLPASCPFVSQVDGCRPLSSRHLYFGHNCAVKRIQNNWYVEYASISNSTDVHADALLERWKLLLLAWTMTVFEARRLIFFRCSVGVGGWSWRLFKLCVRSKKFGPPIKDHMKTLHLGDKRRYLEQHALTSVLQSALNACLNARPEQPLEFFVRIATT